MKLEEALQFADQWTEGQKFYEGSQGWRVVCATLAAEVRRLQIDAETRSKINNLRAESGSDRFNDGYYAAIEDVLKIMDAK